MLLIGVKYHIVMSESCNFDVVQKNSFEEDYTHLRKTKSAENIRCPQIVINQVIMIL